MDISQIEEKLLSFEKRLLNLEGSASARPMQSNQVALTKEPIKTSEPLKNQAPVKSDEAKSGHWLGVIAVICFVVAAAFIIKLSVESGWLTPIRQIGLAALMGFGLIGAGMLLLKSDREYASYLPAGGIVILYLSAFAAHRVYSLITFETAIALTALISGFCVWLYTKVNHDLYAFTAVVGTYLAPLILGNSADDTFSLYYFLVCSLAFSTISILVESRLLTMGTSYFAILMTGYYGNQLNQDVLISVLLALQFLIFAVGTYLYTSVNRKPLTDNESLTFLPVLLIFYSVEFYFLERINPTLAPWASLAFAAVTLGLYFSAKNLMPDKKFNSQSSIYIFVSIVVFHAGYLKLIPQSVHPWLFAIIVLSFTFLPFKTPEKGTVQRLLMFAVLAVLAIEYMGMFSHLLSSNQPEIYLAPSVAAFTSLWILQYFGREKFSSDHSVILLGATHALALMGLYRLSVGSGSLIVSITWLLYGIFVIGIGFAKKDIVMAKTAVFVLGFAGAKALLYDASSAPTQIRILCLLITGAALYGAGFLLRKISTWNEKA